MRKLITLIITLISFAETLSAQTAPPNSMLYQAVARDAAGNLAVRRSVYVRTSIIKGSATGAVMYSDEHKVTSNADAMFTVVVGQGKYLSGSFTSISNIPWGDDKYFFNLKISVAPSLPGSAWKPSYVDMGTSQFWSVPYALFSGTAASSKDSLRLSINGTGRTLRLGSYKPVFFSVADNDSVATNEIQTLSQTGGRLLLSLNGGMVFLPDSSASNEIQNITRNGGRISLSLGGGTITLPDSSATNELQSININGGSISLSHGGGMIALPDSSASNEIQTLRLKSDSLFISNSNGLDLYPILGAGAVKMKDYQIPDGFSGLQKIKYTIVPLTTTATPPSSTVINPYTVPAGKNFYIRKVSITTPFTQCAAGFYLNGSLIVPTAGAGCGYVFQEPILAGENMVVTANLGCPGSWACTTWYCDFEGYLVDKTVTAIYDKSNYIVPTGSMFIKVSSSTNFPEVYNSGESVPPFTNGYLLKK
jgi:hypothetical protein